MCRLNKTIAAENTIENAETYPWQKHTTAVAQESHWQHDKTFLADIHHSGDAPMILRRAVDRQTSDSAQQVQVDSAQQVQVDGTTDLHGGTAQPARFNRIEAALVAYMCSLIGQEGQFCASSNELLFTLVHFFRKQHI